MRPPALLLTVLLLTPAAAMGQGAPLAAPRGGLFEVSGFAHRVSDGFGDWRGGRLRAVLPAGARDLFHLEAVGQRAFGDDGIYASAAHQHTFGDSWISYLAVSGGSGDFFFPDLRLDALLTRKLLPSRRLLLSAGGTWVTSKGVYRDRTAVAAATAYLGASAVLEVGGRFNWSTPGDLSSQRGYAALTLGRSGERFLVVRGGAGTEAYQLTGISATERRFRSSEVAVTWREWLGPRIGMLVGGERYHNPFYSRAGAQLGLFAAW